MIVGGEWEGQEKKYLNSLLKLKNKSKKGGYGTNFRRGRGVVVKLD
jgi:hypothetical protein